ncbi:MAG: Ig-like domain-containing protein [Candidatus Kapaibacteriales bacterium]
MSNQKFFYFIFFSIITFGGLNLLFCNPKISYVLPDIGTPGLATYIEIISPYDLFGSFGNDGLYSPSDSTVKIFFDRPEDTSKIIVGPICVSWQGRMISTYFFVNPNMPTPNSEDWRLLDSQFKIPFRVIVNGNLSNIDTFYIVKPYNFSSNLLQSNQIFGEGALGIRSRSGAMIVVNLNLSAMEYRVFLDNSITFPNPNRSYLPFVMICKENIIGQGSSTKINVSAGEGAIQNAGPGGGGGGGRFCDYLTGNQGEDGGRGFVSGGRGGTNNLFGGGTYKSLATGTGDSGKSLNGISPPAIPYGFESSGGGTGHPFGKSGIGSGDQSSWDYPGGYGGGTGSINNRMGGSGGYATDGKNEPQNYNNGGKTHGNPMIVPLAGGSGGASGNPSGLNVCSGSGGGGGGAISIFAKRIENLSIAADGKNGGSSSNGAGGGGSGGGIIVSAKLATSNLNISAKGGNGGGYGWIRVDAPVQSSLIFSHTDPPPFRSITTDTISYVKKKFMITGSKSTSSDTLILFLKPETGNWSSVVLNNLRGTNSWQKEFTLSTKDTVIYFCAVEDFGYSIVDTFKYQTRYVLSQSATNILFVDKFPEIICTDEVNLNGKECNGFRIVDSIPIINTGNANLSLNFNSAYFKHSNGFEIVNPKSMISLPSGDTAWIIFSFTYSKGLGQQVIDTLVFEHNDSFASKNPWEVVFKISLDRFLFENIDLSSFFSIDTIDFGEICSKQVQDTFFAIRNKSVFPIDFALKVSSSTLSISSSRKIINSNSFDTIKITLNPNSKYGEVFDSIEVYPVDCPELKRYLIVKYFVANPNTQFLYNNQNVDTIDFGDVCIGKIYHKGFFLKNIGNIAFKTEYQISGDSSEFILQSFSDGFLNIAEADSFAAVFAPSREGKFSLVVTFDFNICNFKDTIVLLGRGVQSNSVVVDNSGSGFVFVGEKDTIKIKIVNKGTGVSYFDQAPIASGVFRFISSQPDLPTYLRRGDTLILFFEFEPQTDSLYSQVVVIFSNSLYACPDTVRFTLQGSGTKSKIFSNIDSVFYGNLPYCSAKDTTIYISNKGTSTLRINRVYINEINIPQHFSISNLPSSTIPPGGIDSCAVKFRGWKNASPGLKTADLVIENNDINNPELRIKLSAIQENLSVKIQPDTIDFGFVQLGDSKRFNVSLENDGNIQQRISNFTSSSGNFSSNPNALVLDPKVKFNVTITFSPSKVGLIYDTLKVIYYIPCPDTQFIFVRGVGVEGDFSYPDTIDFGTVSICSNDTLTFPIHNLGTIPFSIDSVSITGKYAAYYEVLTNFPIVVDSTAKISIVSIGGNEAREFFAELNIYVYINNSTRHVKIPLRTNRTRFVYFNPKTINIGMVQLLSEFNTSTTIQNNSAYAVFIIDYYGFDSNSSFQVIDLNIGSAISATSSTSFTIKTIPKFIGSILDTLFVVVKYPDCLDTIQLVVQSFGVAPYEFNLRLAEVNLDPKIANALYPVYLKVTSSMSDSLRFPILIDSISGTFNFNWHLFHITKMTKGEILEDRIDNEFRFITFKVDTVVVKDSEEFILTEFIGIPLLGDVDTALVLWDSAYSTYFKPVGWSRVPDSLLTSGIIKTNICREGGPRLVKPLNTSFIVLHFKNQDSEPIILLKLLQAKKVKMNIFNIIGENLYSAVFERDNADEFIVRLPEYLPIGIYFVKFFDSYKYETFKIYKE